MGLLKRKFEDLFNLCKSWKQVVLYLIYAICVTVLLYLSINAGIDKVTELLIEGL